MKLVVLHHIRYYTVKTRSRSCPKPVKKGERESGVLMGRLFECDDLLSLYAGSVGQW